MTHEQAYTADFRSILTEVRDHIVLWRAVEGCAYSATIAAASGKQQHSGLGCYCCGGGQYVKQCPMKSAIKGTSPKKASSSKKVVCFRCGSTEHLVKDGPKPLLSAGALDRQDFCSEDEDRGSLSSVMEI